ncbi:MAG TPA: helix-turn-helix domain-containing protein [Candidatus Acidoferrales bacterium]|nr:helix-turn-helix domain-containing protein [Candidatus Acidoferrales bacterium]
MRRLVIEAPAAEFTGFLWEPLVDGANSLEVLAVLRKDRADIALVCRVQLRNPKSGYRNLFVGSGLTAQLLDSREDESCVLFVKGRVRVSKKWGRIWTVGGYMTGFAIREGTLKMTFLGTAEQVKAFLKSLSNSKVHYKTLLLTDAKFSPESLLRQLTDKQRRVLTAGFSLGYYDTPRRISSDELAHKLGISNPTLVTHSRKAEKKLIEEVLKSG